MNRTMHRAASLRPLRRLADSNTRAGRRPLVSLTPLIDVVFILLIFFMLASSFLDWRAIALNAPPAAGGASSIEGALLVEVMPGRLRLAGETLSLDALAERIGRQVALVPERRVVIKPAKGVSLQQAVQVLDRLTLAGAGNLSLVRDR